MAAHARAKLATLASNASPRESKDMNETRDPIWVGVDLVDGNVGPMNFARWLLEQGEPAHRLHAAHIVEPWTGFGIVPADLDVDWRQLATQRTRAELEKAGVPADRSAVEVGMDESPEDYLARLFEQGRAGQLVIGRLARRGQDRLIRLGSVARRLLRALPGPLAIVPPDLPYADIGKGPVAVAIDAKEDCVPAYRYAQQLAQDAGRELLLVHVVPMPEGWGLGIAGAEVVDRVLRDLEIDGRRKLEAWSRTHGVFGHEAVVTQGPVVAELHEIMRDRDCPCIVLGSRRLGPVGRWFAGSTATDLAAAATMPVIVVPPKEAS